LKHVFVCCFHYVEQAEHSSRLFDRDAHVERRDSLGKLVDGYGTVLVGVHFAEFFYKARPHVRVGDGSLP